MLDPQDTWVRDMVDKVAERIATLGGEPRGTAWLYLVTPVGMTTHWGGHPPRAPRALNVVYDEVIASRDAQETLSSKMPSPRP